MSVLDELQALTTSIGEHCVSAFGRESLRGLQVTLDPRDMTSRVTVALREDSIDEHKRIIGEFFDIEELFFDETVITLNFVDSIDTSAAAKKSVPAFSLV